MAARNQVLLSVHDTRSIPALPMSGDEWWPILGGLITEEEAREVIRRCAGLDRRRDCLRKAVIAREVLGRGLVTAGSLVITNGPAVFGNPYTLRLRNGRLEGDAYHFFLMTDLGVIDLSLGGWMEAAALSAEKHGRPLPKQRPFVLAAEPPGGHFYFPRSAWTCEFSNGEPKLTMIIQSGPIRPRRYRKLVDAIMNGTFKQPRDAAGVYLLPP